MTTETKIELGAVQPPVKKPRGRPAKTTTQRIRELYRAGFTPKQIAAKTGADMQHVYQIRYLEKKRQQEELASKLRVVGKSFTPAPVKIKGARIPYNTVTVVAPQQQPKPTFWQRVKAVFFPN